jgi:hypothetical protein
VKKLATPIPTIALTIPKAAAALDVGEDFFREQVLPELRIVRRGSKRLIAVKVDPWAMEGIAGRRRFGRKAALVWIAEGASPCC